MKVQQKSLSLKLQPGQLQFATRSRINLALHRRLCFQSWISAQRRAGSVEMKKEPDTQSNLWFSVLKLLICSLNLCICTKYHPESSLSV